MIAGEKPEITTQPATFQQLSKAGVSTFDFKFETLDCAT
jgi:hypothetical protein